MTSCGILCTEIGGMNQFELNCVPLSKDKYCMVNQLGQTHSTFPFSLIYAVSSYFKLSTI